MKIIKKISIGTFFVIGGLLLLFLLVMTYFNFPVSNFEKKANIGITFSNRYSEDIGLNWKENYIALLDDLKIKKIRIPVYWDRVENSKGEFNYENIDWQLEEARKRNVDIILAVGQKVPRWPECYVPEWVENDQERKERLFNFVETTINRYKKGHPEIKYWQIENEPFLAFGICPPMKSELLDKELALVKKIDDSRKIVVTDSGELSTWLPVAKRADVFGTTMYMNIYKDGWGYYVYPLGPRFFQAKKWLIEAFANQDKSMVVELQAEPWIAGWTTNAPLKEQFKSMNKDKLREHIEYAKASGFSEIYLWGAEWWYWLKTHKNYPDVWNEMKIILEENN